MAKTATLGSFDNSSHVTKHRYGPVTVRMNISLSNNVFDYFSLKTFCETSTGLVNLVLVSINNTFHPSFGVVAHEVGLK